MGFSENFCQVSSLYKGWTFQLLMGGVGDLVQAGILFNPFMHQGICSQGCLIFFVLRVTHAFFGSLVVGMNLFLVQECMRDIFQNHPGPLPSKVNWSTPKGLGNGAILSSLRSRGGGVTQLDLSRVSCVTTSKCESRSTQEKK